MTSAVRDNAAEHRFELDTQAGPALAYYRRADGVITFTHTETPFAVQGQGIASKLIRGALEQVRAEGLKVVARCSFVAAYIARHPEYADLVR